MGQSSLGWEEIYLRDLTEPSVMELGESVFLKELLLIFLGWTPIADPFLSGLRASALLLARRRLLGSMRPGSLITIFKRLLRLFGDRPMRVWLIKSMIWGRGLETGIKKSLGMCLRRNDSFWRDLKGFRNLYRFNSQAFLLGLKESLVSNWMWFFVGKN